MLAVATQAAPQRLDDPAAEAARIEVRSTVACVDRFLASSESDALVGYYSRITPMKDLLTDLSTGPPNSQEEISAKDKLYTCIDGVSRKDTAREGVDAYVGAALIDRGLERKLGAPSVDLSRLRQFSFNDILLGKLSEQSFRASMTAIGIPEQLEKSAIAYIALHKLKTVMADMAHGPLVPARRTAGEITDADYPRDARALKGGGDSVLTFEISASGTVERCEVLYTSGVEALDEAACKLVTERFRYEPARDDKGRPARQREMQTIEWRLKS